jgi:hypothetical protein
MNVTAVTGLPLRAADLRGLFRLGIDGTVGITDLVEAMHHTIASRVGMTSAPPPGRNRGITGAVYGAVRATTRTVGIGADLALRVVDQGASHHAGTPEREAFVAALNGLWGDHLADSGNPLAIRTALRTADGRALDLDGAPLAPQLPGAGGRLLVLAHGLCMSDRQWTREGHDHGRRMARELGFTPLYLHYNSGRHVSQNGRDFAALLQQLRERWPVPVEEIVIVGHSMGGLVARSACHHAEVEHFGWLRELSALVFLGTPHHGAPLERGGRWLDLLLGLSPYVAPFARLGKARSAGITDLRFGNLQDADWRGRDRHAQHRDDRRPTPLPAGVPAYVVAATMAQKPGRLHHSLIGDGLVPLASALGEHRRPSLALRVPDTHRLVVAVCGHLELLSHEQVYAQLHRWLR